MTARWPGKEWGDRPGKTPINLNLHERYQSDTLLTVRLVKILNELLILDNVLVKQLVRSQRCG